MPSTMLSIIAYLTLNFMYMKFLIIWRTFRTFSLLDGIYTPENMRRCITDGATFKGFWRFVDHIRSNVNQVPNSSKQRLACELFRVADEIYLHAFGRQ
jgi:hypothetical protein